MLKSPVSLVFRYIEFEYSDEGRKRADALCTAISVSVEVSSSFAKSNISCKHKHLERIFVSRALDGTLKMHELPRILSTAASF
jgi:hypothetical protein